jgi:hypothetical protein
MVTLCTLSHDVRSSHAGGAATWARKGRASARKGGWRRRTGSARWRWKPRLLFLTPLSHQEKNELTTKLMHIETTINSLLGLP